MVQSAAFRINAERLMLLAWPRAILLQMAHPLIAAAVAEHSTFRGGPISAAKRLHGTVRAMLDISFGDPRESEQAIEGIRAIHRRVNGSLKRAVGPYPAGTRYSAEDPALLRWVHLTLIDSILEVYPQVVEPLSEADRNAYCADAASVAIALGARESEIPRTHDDLRRAFDEVVASGALAVGDDARAIADAVLTPSVPRGLSWTMRPLSRLQRRVTIPALPDVVRIGYGWGGDPAAHAATLAARARTFARLRRLRRWTPAAIAWWPQARSSSSKGPTVGARAASTSRSS